MAESGHNPSLAIHLLGGWDVKVSGKSPSSRLSRKEQWLLAKLALQCDYESSRDTLAVSLWPDSTESQAKFYLRKCLSNLRHSLGPEAHRIVSPTHRTVRLDMSGCYCDVLAFDAVIARAVVSETPEHLFKEAAELYRGPFVPECLDDWASSERTRCEQAYLNALDRLAELSLARGEPATAIRWLRRLVVADPYRESAVCTLLNSLAKSGDRAALQQAYQELRTRLRNELSTAPAAETDALYRELMLREAKPSRPLSSLASSAEASLRHLPVPLSGLIGREQESEEIAGWLRNCRLVTLLGPGGVGKTRLSIAVADAVLPRFAHGVWFVDLSPLTEPSLVPELLSRAFGLQEESDLPAVVRLTRALASRSLLIVLDNCEHVVDTCASITHQLLGSCAEVRILATSRQVLGLTGEQVYSVPSLSLPPEVTGLFGSGAEVAEKDCRSLLEYEAVRLFVERAKQCTSSFVLTRANAGVVVEICRRLDGFPLAIEMAAARVRSLSVSEINDRLADRFQLLKSGSRAALPRQQTLRAALDWGYELLTAEEQCLHNRLAVFVGGFTLEAALAVSAVQDPDECLETLISLVDKSLVIYDGGENRRYRMLETILEYGRERLDGDGLLLELKRGHRDFFQKLVHEALLKRKTSKEAEAFAQVELDYSNVRAMLDFCAEDPDSVGHGLHSAYGLLGFWLARGSLVEGKEWYKRMLACPRADLHALHRADALRAFGALLYYLGGCADAEEMGRSALAIYRDLGDDARTAVAIGDLANFVLRAGNLADARRLFEESLVICRDLNRPMLISKTLHGFAGLCLAEEDYEGARKLLREALDVYEELGSRSEIAKVYELLAISEHQMGNYAAARANGELGLSIAREVNNRLYISDCLCILTSISLDQRRNDECLARIRELLELQQLLRIKPDIDRALGALATLAYRRERWDLAAVLGAYAGVDQGTRHEQTAAICRSLGEQSFKSACARAADMTEAEALEYALAAACRLSEETLSRPT